MEYSKFVFSAKELLATYTACLRYIAERGLLCNVKLFYEDIGSWQLTKREESAFLNRCGKYCIADNSITRLELHYTETFRLLMEHERISSYSRNFTYDDNKYHRAYGDIKLKDLEVSDTDSNITNIENSLVKVYNFLSKNRQKVYQNALYSIKKIQNYHRVNKFLHTVQGLFCLYPSTIYGFDGGFYYIEYVNGYNRSGKKMQEVKSTISKLDIKIEEYKAILKSAEEQRSDELVKLKKLDGYVEN